MRNMKNFLSDSVHLTTFPFYFVRACISIDDNAFYTNQPDVIRERDPNLNLMQQISSFRSNRMLHCYPYLAMQCGNGSFHACPPIMCTSITLRYRIRCGLVNGLKKHELISQEKT